MRYLIGYGYLAVLFAVMLGIQKLFRLSTEVSRKITHILIGFTWVILYFFFMRPETVKSWELLILPITFILVNALSYRYKIFTMIERTEGENHPGTVYYAVAITVLMLLVILSPDMVIPSGIAVFALSFGDGFAALFGSLFGKKSPKITRDKSLVGSFSCFVGAFLSIYLLKLIVPFTISVYAVLILAFLTAVFELVGHGLDNFSITFGIAGASYVLLFTDLVDSPLLVLSLLTGAVIAVLTVYLHALTKGGAASAFVIVSGCLYFGGYPGFLVLLFSFLIISFVGKLTKKKRETREEGIPEKEGARDLVQVSVNGGAALFLFFLFFLTQQRVFFLAAVAALAEALGDSMASEIGVLSKKMPRDIWGFVPRPHGYSGGVTPLGTLSALFGVALTVGFSAFLFPMSIIEALLIALSAFLGVALDSLIGSRLQRKRTCTVCGKYTEKRTHCSETTRDVGGISFLGNDLVNLLSNVMSAGIALGLFLLF